MSIRRNLSCLLALLLLALPVTAAAPVVAAPVAASGPAVDGNSINKIIGGISKASRYLTPRNYWVWPVDWVQTVTREFSPPPAGAPKWSAGYHRGVDLAVPPKNTVYAPDAGTISFSGWVAGRPVVSIDHGDGLVSSMEPVAALLPRGMRVSRGQPIGTLHGTGHSAGPGGGGLPKQALNQLITKGAGLLGNVLGGLLGGPGLGKLLGEAGEGAAQFALVQSGEMGGIHVGARKHGVYVNPLLFFGKVKPSVLLPLSSKRLLSE